MSSALKRGRTLNPEAVEDAKKWREDKLRELEKRPILSLSFKERHLLKTLQAQR